MQKEMNKKGQDLSIGTLILIVLGIIVLVLLILGFSLGWGNLWDRINIFGGTTSVADVVTACRLAVTSQDTYTYCEKSWTIKNSTGKSETVSCQLLKSRGNLPDITMNCQNSGSVQYNCVPDQTQCETKKESRQLCEVPSDKKTSVCQFTTVSTTNSCTLNGVATTTCNQQTNNKDECEKIQGCKYLSP